ncbi:MAG: hypothetical protein ACQKBY_08780 [Verrucomicrobiales bacterium]
MSTTTQQPQRASKKLTKADIVRRLQEARARNEELKEQGKLPKPTKQWSNDSVKSLKIALSTKVPASR